MQTFAKSPTIITNHDNEATLVEKARIYALEIVEKSCKNYFFHNPSHTESVFDRATYLAMTE